MKKILAICLVLIAILPASAENKNVLRIGAGTTWVVDPDNKSVYGPLVSIEYQYNFSKYVGLYASASMARVNMPKFSNSDAYVVGAVGVMVTPLPNSFRFIKIGANFLYNNHLYSEGFDKPYDSYHESHVGFGFPIRAYLIDNLRFELSGGFEFITEFRKSGYVCLAYHMCLQFGVKF
jgi:hypothetical protein